MQHFSISFFKFPQFSRFSDPEMHGIFRLKFWLPRIFMFSYPPWMHDSLKFTWKIPKTLLFRGTLQDPFWPFWHFRQFKNPSKSRKCLRYSFRFFTNFHSKSVRQISRFLFKFRQNSDQFCTKMIYLIP